MKYRLLIDPHAEEEIVATVHAPSPLTEELENLIRAHEGTDRITAYGEQETVTLLFEEIECFTVIDRRLLAVASDGTRYRLRQRLCEIEPLLPFYFVRINKSTVVNEHRIRRFKSSFSGAVDAVLLCGYSDYVSRRCLAALKRRLGI